MTKRSQLQEDERSQLIDNLYAKHGRSSPWRWRWLYFRKKYSWLLVILIAKFIKRSLDILVSISLLVLLSPLILLIALLIKISDGGPILYVSRRVGRWGKEFKFPKFRSMHFNAEKEKDPLKALNLHGEDVTFKMQNDPRITKLGRFLRKTSIDELPQLWCVLKGEMSLVGPRPPLPEEVAAYSPKERIRLEITPGLTCLWQVSGRSDIPFSKQLQLDSEYIQSQSAWLDVKILLKTIPAVIFGKGAY